jgi:DNA-binding IclR family transcriptional regulator
MSNAAQTRLLDVIEALSGNEVFGARLRDIAAAVHAGEHSVLRDLQTLETAGWAQQMPDKKWRLAAKPVQIFANFQHGLFEASRRVDEVRHGYTRTPSYL